MNVKPRILVLTLSFGSGHPRAARAIAKELEKISPEAEVRVVDALEVSRWWFHVVYVWPYWVLVRHFSRAWGRLFETRLKKMHGRTAPDLVFRRGCPQVFELIGLFQPNVLVAVEVAACEMAALAKRSSLTNARIVGVITDYEAEPVWVKQEVDAYAVADEGVRTQLIRWGGSAEKIQVTGIPVDDGFTAKQEPGMPRPSDDRGGPLVLLMGGGMGPTRMDQVAEALCQSGMPMQIIAVTGHDTHVRKRMERLPAQPPVSLRVTGWTEEIPALMQAASVLVTKPGGLTITEAALCGVPIILFDPIPGPERLNAARLVQAGAALITNKPDETASAVVSLLRDDRARRAMSLKARSLVNANAAAQIARIILNEQAHARKTARTA